MTINDVVEIINKLTKDEKEHLAMYAKIKLSQIWHK